MQLIKTTREGYRELGKGTTQVLIEGDFIVPDIKPDISSILRVGAVPVIEEEKGADDRAGFKGKVNVNVIYLAKKSDRHIHSMTDELMFENFINIDGTTRLSDIEVVAELSHLEYRLINDRKVGIKAIVTVTASAFGKVEDEYLQGVEGNELQIKESTVVVGRKTENKKDRFVIKEELELNSSNAEIADILECQVDLCKKEVKAVKDGVNIKGEALISLLYTSNSDDGIIEMAEFAVAFNGIVEISGITENMQPYARLNVGKVEAFVVSNDNGEDKVLDIEITANVLAGANVQEEVQFIEDAYSTEKEIEIEKRTLEYPVMTGKTEARVLIKENVTLEAEHPSIMQVVRAWGTCYTDNVMAEENGAVVEGATSVQIMYIANDDSTPVQVVDFMLPFEQRVEIKGTNANSILETACSVERAGISMLSDREIEITVTLLIDAKAYENVETQVISDIVEGSIPRPLPASIVIYIVQEGDTLWEIAKKYNTTVDAILAVNEIENMDLIYPGEKLLILRTNR